MRPQHCLPVGKLFVFRALHLVFERGEFARCFGQLFCVERVDFGQLFAAVGEERLVEPKQMLIHSKEKKLLLLNVTYHTEALTIFY
jgi:hypothetical protein